MGQTPIIRYRYDHARISVIGGLSISPQRRRHLRGHVIVIWDGASIHHPKSLHTFCSHYPRLHLEKLPAYAPELNPIAAAWHAAKHPLANGRADNIPEPGCSLLASLRQTRASQRVLRGCITQSDLPPFCSKYCITYETISN